MLIQQEQTDYIGVDLVVLAQFDLAPLTQALVPELTLRNQTEEGGMRVGVFELSEVTLTAEQALDAFARAVDGLPPRLRAKFFACDDRCFDVIIQAGLEPETQPFPLSTDALATIVRLKARLVVSIYGAGVREETIN